MKNFHDDEMDHHTFLQTAGQGMINTWQNGQFYYCHSTMTTQFPGFKVQNKHS